MADDKFELYVGKSSKLENTVLNIEGQAKIDGLVSGELKTKILHIGEGGKVVGKVDAEHIVVDGTLESAENEITSSIKSPCGSIIQRPFHCFKSSIIIEGF